jgi:hypothetical protein
VRSIREAVWRRIFSLTPLFVISSSSSCRSCWAAARHRRS